ncbi:AsnC family transcriptional regulator [Halogeometricum sp. S1BR25-6]|jgi:DNA-binding Lrp family transcriptional regulator/YHS domain-containing protein|uniref:AsnC family transcriptional regulator n=1 Tax=Halogeometricum salsisoli TaxID=2950536 RepID=A0ABU2GKG3_9EURY|nr:AsnC family transcriptional regulator [Halogeometricum sp. S1BR25-6]MDS0301304.1 AsnC family transcriptional regulator [Halogeometricum sp. S1BR25-6]
MRDLDETDMEILSLLAEDARRPFSAIGETVGLSGPAVSDRVKRLRESGIINRFTVDVNRKVLRAGVPVFVQVEHAVNSTESLRERLTDVEGVEHVFVTAEGDVWFYGRAENQNVRRWIESLLRDFDVNYSVTLVDQAEWTPSIDGTAFAITCVECGNTVDNEGESARIADRVYHFCCSSCHTKFEKQYQKLEEQA